MSDYRGMWEDIEEMQREDRLHPERPLLRERESLLRQLSEVEKQLEKLGVRLDKP